MQLIAGTLPVWTFTLWTSWLPCQEVCSLSLWCRTEGKIQVESNSHECGLIVNELVCNSLKYAFSGKIGELCIYLKADNDNNLTLTVSDNGIGLPEDFDLETTESLGLQLVTALTSQLEGTLDINRNIGTEFNITFPNKTL